MKALEGCGVIRRATLEMSSEEVPSTSSGKFKTGFILYNRLSVVEAMFG